MVKLTLTLEFVALLGALPLQLSGQNPDAFPPPRQEPVIVTPGRTSADPPSDALILFDGKGLGAWRSADGSAAKWQMRDG